MCTRALASLLFTIMASPAFCESALRDPACTDGLSPAAPQWYRWSLPSSPLQPVAGVFPDARSAKPLSAAEERALQPKDLFKECQDCPEMVMVPAGEFLMGAPVSEQNSDDDERPQH